MTDPETGIGVWIHYEMIAPVSKEPAYGHGFIGIFEPGKEPVLQRFGPSPWSLGQAPIENFRLTGDAGDISWDIGIQDSSATLYTFPRWVWEREVLPAAQIVPAPCSLHFGTVRIGQRELKIEGAPGATGQIYGHGFAAKWAWLHAGLGDDNVLEIVAAQSKKPVWRMLPMLAFVKLRLDGKEYRPLLAKTKIELPHWTVQGGWLKVTVTQKETLRVPFTDTDGSQGVVHNCEIADAYIEWGERVWDLRGTAHAEVGLR